MWGIKAGKSLTYWVPRVDRVSAIGATAVVSLFFMVGGVSNALLSSSVFGWQVNNILGAS